VIYIFYIRNKQPQISIDVISTLNKRLERIEEVPNIKLINLCRTVHVTPPTCTVNYAIIFYGNIIVNRIISHHKEDVNV